MKERPILFSGPMVRALLEGRKTQTRRVCRKATDEHAGLEPAASVHPDGSGEGWIAWFGGPVSAEETVRRYPGAEGFRCPYGVPGDRLWVRETWQPFDTYGDEVDEPRVEIGYRASNDVRPDGVAPLDFGASLIRPCPAAAWLAMRDDIERMEVEGDRWRPSIFMPRWASRITLEVTDVRVQRVQEISEEDARAEGVEQANGHAERGAFFGRGPCYQEGFAQIWADIHGGSHASFASNPWVWCISFRRIRCR